MLTLSEVLHLWLISLRSESIPSVAVGTVCRRPDVWFVLQDLMLTPSNLLTIGDLNCSGERVIVDSTIYLGIKDLVRLMLLLFMLYVFVLYFCTEFFTLTQMSATFPHPYMTMSIMTPYHIIMTKWVGITST